MTHGTRFLALLAGSAIVLALGHLRHSTSPTVQTTVPRSPFRLRGHLDRIPPTVGIDLPVPVRWNAPTTKAQALEHIQLSPPVPVRLIEKNPTHYFIMPQHFWPGKTQITIRLTNTSGTVAEHESFATDASKEIRVNLSTQTLSAWENGRQIRQMLTSTGVAPRWTTPTGTFWIFRRVADDHMKGGFPGSKDSWDVQHVPWAQYIYGGIAIHGAWWNRTFGIPKSHGCIQLSTRTRSSPTGPSESDAEWLWHFSDLGTPVVIDGRTPRVTRTPAPYPRESNASQTFSRSFASSNR